ncbi:helix-turn-helix domain-containing protein [Pseudomonas baltica]
MSVQAMSWALSRRDLGKDSSARHVLLCLANYAAADGRGAFPSAKTLTEDTGLSERTVRSKLDLLEGQGLIVRGNQALAAVYIDRHDRRPVVYDLMLKRGAVDAPREEGTGCIQQQNGVQPTTERGAAIAPNTSLNHQLTEQQHPHEISDVVAEQDLAAAAALDGSTEGRQRFSMFAGWSINPAALAAQFKIMGIPDTLTDEAFGSFMGFHMAKPDIRDTDGGWHHRLAKWTKRQATESATGSEDGSANWAAKGVRL